MHFALAFSQTLEQSGTSISYFQLLARRMKVRKRRRPTVGKKVGKAFVDQMASLPRIPSQWGKVDQGVASQHFQHHHHGYNDHHDRHYRIVIMMIFTFYRVSKKSNRKKILTSAVGPNFPIKMTCCCFVLGKKRAKKHNFQIKGMPATDD